jgi:predicted PurR-regulated permease PerM
VKLPSWRHKDRAAAGAAEAEPVSVEPQAIKLDMGQLRELSAVFGAPRWLRDIGIASWLLVGLTLLVVGLMALLTITSVIVEPVLIGLILATVSTPVVTWLQRKGVPRLGGAFLVLVGFLALGVLILVMVLGGIVGQSDEIKSSASAAAAKAQSWLEDAGVDSSGASSANQNVSDGTSSTISTFVKGLGAAVQGVTALVFFVVFSVFSLLFLLKDGPSFRRFVDSHMGVPLNVAQTITGNVISALRRYFGGVTIVATFNAVVVGLGALILDVPLAGTIAVVTFVTAYIPFIGAFVSGAFAVILALGSEGTQTALIMLVIVLLANGLLQNVVQPIAFGATLRMNPLLVLVTTIGFGAIFGMSGLVLGAPLTSAAIHITGDLAKARAAAAAGNAEAEGGPEPSSGVGEPSFPGAPG